MYSLHPDKHYALGKLLSKKQPKKPAGTLVQSLAQRLYVQQQKQALNGGR